MDKKCGFVKIKRNQKLDNNKTITSIKYNHLNLPTEILFANTNTKITYLYNAAGVKLSKAVKTTASITKTTDYLNGYQYLRTSATAVPKLQFFPTAEGYVSVTYVNATTNSYNYVYNYTDQLGNVRLSYGKDPITNVLTILEENNYYPYGLKHTSYNANVNAYSLTYIKPVTPVIATNVTVNAYKYNGKEYQDELALNEYDMDMRDYDPSTGVWTGIDPVVHFSQSPYSSFDGNPVLYSDPSGADGVGGWTTSQSFGSTYETPNSLGYNNGYCMGSSGSFGVYDPKNQSLANWGDGIVAPWINKSGNSFTINWNAFGNGTYNWNASTGVVKQWHEGSFDASPDFKGNDFVNQLGNVNLGYWETVSGGGLGITGAQSAGSIIAADSLTLALSYGALEFIGLDLSIPEPTDLFVPKYVVYAVVAVVATAIIYYSVDHFAQHGKNRVTATDVDILIEKEEAGTITNLEKQTLKRHRKGTRERPSRQTKDIK